MNIPNLTLNYLPISYTQAFKMLRTWLFLWLMCTAWSLHAAVVVDTGTAWVGEWLAKMKQHKLPI